MPDSHRRVAHTLCNATRPEPAEPHSAVVRCPRWPAVALWTCLVRCEPMVKACTLLACTDSVSLFRRENSGYYRSTLQLQAFLQIVVGEEKMKSAKQGEAWRSKFVNFPWQTRQPRMARYSLAAQVQHNIVRSISTQVHMIRVTSHNLAARVQMGSVHCPVCMAALQTNQHPITQWCCMHVHT